MLTFKFSGADGVMTVSETLTSGMVGKQVKLEFTSDWDNLTKTAVFEAGDISVAVYDLSDTVAIPEEVLSISRRRLKIGIYGEDAQGNVTPTIYATGPRIEEGADPYRASGDPPMPKWKELEKRIEDLENGNSGGGTGGGSGSNSSQNVELDTTLTQSGKAADAKAVGDKFAEVFGAGTVINQNGGGVLKIWAGTQSEYDALLVKDTDTVYLIDGATSSGGSGDSGEEETHTHSYSSEVTTAATCTTAGVRTYTCTCGDSYTESIPATGHNYVNGVCTVCGTADPDYDEGSEDNTDYTATIFTNGPFAEGYIDDTGSVQALANNYYYDHLVAADGFYVQGATTVRIAEYDADGAFLSRSYASGLCLMATNENTKYIKGGYTGVGDATMAYLRETSEELFVDAGTLDASGNIVEESPSHCTSFIELSDNIAKIVIVVLENQYPVKIAFYDSDNMFIERKYAAKTLAVDVPANAAYFKVSKSSDYRWYTTLML